MTKCIREGKKRCNKKCTQLQTAALRGHVDPYAHEAPEADAAVESMMWVLGAANENCDQACGGRSMGCDNDILDYVHSSRTEMQNAQWQVDAFHMAGVDCNTSESTFSYGASAALPAFSYQLPGL